MLGECRRKKRKERYHGMRSISAHIKEGKTRVGLMIKLVLAMKEKYEKYKSEHVSSKGSIGNISGDVDVKFNKKNASFNHGKRLLELPKVENFMDLDLLELLKGSTANSQKFLSWKDPEFQEYLNSKLEEERSEKEELKRELDHYKKKTDKLGKMMKTLMNSVGGSFGDCFSDDDE